MAASVVLCEKPKQAQAVRAAVGNKFGQVLAAQGHILRLWEPHEVNPDWEKWGYDVLTPPDGQTFFPTKPAERTKDLFKTIKAAIETADQVVIATDCDREGELIGREIVDACPRFRGKLKRAIFTAVDEKSIRDAFAKLRPASDFDRLYAAARCRATFDQIANLTLTRAVTVGYRPPGWKGAIGVGRVKTPTLSLICRRENKIAAFVPRQFYELRLDAAADAGAEVSLWWRGAGEKRLFDKARAEAICETGRAWSGKLKVTRERKRKAPGKLPHLTELQKRAGKWGWSPDKTLDVAQALYDERKIVTYPRSECRYLSEDQAGEAPAMLEGLRAIADFAPVTPATATIRKGGSGHYCTAEVEKASHDAIVPNYNMADKFAAIWPQLSDDERKLFDLIARLWLAAVSPDAVFDETVIKAEPPVRCDPDVYPFRTVGRVEVEPGWRAVFAKAQAESSDDDAEQDKDAAASLPDIPDGAAAQAKDCAPVEKTTTPPKRFKPADLPDAMENAWRFVEDEAQRDQLKDAKGIGTPATRASIIDGLLQQKLIVEQKKQVVPTDLGMQVFELLDAVVPVITDPGETARMEMALDGVLEGKYGADKVIARAIARTGELVEALRKSEGGAHVLKSNVPPTPKMVAAAKAVAEAKGVALPDEAKTDFAACSAFLDAHARPAGAPSEKMVAAAQAIIAGGTEAPGNVLTDFDACKVFLDAHMQARPPSEKQIAFARKIAEERSLTLPDDVLTSGKTASAWIDANLKGKGESGKKPSSAKPRRPRKTAHS